VGIAFTTTVVARRAQFHQSRLGEHLSLLDPNYVGASDQVSSLLGLRSGDGAGAAPMIYRELLRQSSALAFNDAFLTISVLMISVLPLVLIMKRIQQPVGGGALH